MASKFAECTLGQKYRVERSDGHVSGGPMHYLEAGLRELGCDEPARAEQLERELAQRVDASSPIEVRTVTEFGGRLQRGLVGLDGQVAVQRIGKLLFVPGAQRGRSAAYLYRR